MRRRGGRDLAIGHIEGPPRELPPTLQNAPPLGNETWIAAQKCAIIAVAINQMRFTFDPAKNAKNIAERGLSFALAAELDWEAALIVEDARHDYGELRLRVLALLHGRLYEQRSKTEPLAP